MFRPVDRPLNFRQRANEWIHKMLFLWSREAAPIPKGSPWLAWFATAFVLWSCRRSVTKAILAISPLRLLKKRKHFLLTNAKSSSTATLSKHHHHQRLKLENPILQRKHKHGIRRVKRFCNGDGPHVTSSTSVIQIPQIRYRVTRSGKIYGKYPHEVTVPANAGHGSR